MEGEIERREPPGGGRPEAPAPGTVALPPPPLLPPLPALLPLGAGQLDRKLPVDLLGLGGGGEPGPAAPAKMAATDLV